MNAADSTSTTGMPEPADSESVLQSAVWLAREIGIDCPPVPDIYADALNEVAVGRLYATDPALLALDSRASIATALSQSQWPRSGLAFGFKARGSGGRWFYSLVSDQQIIHVSLGLRFDSDESALATAAFVSRAHLWLDFYLSDETNYFRATMSTPLAHDAPRRVIAYSDESYVPTETHASWLAGAALGEFVTRAEVFAEPATPDETGDLILRA